MKGPRVHVLLPDAALQKARDGRIFIDSQIVFPHILRSTCTSDFAVSRPGNLTNRRMEITLNSTLSWIPGGRRSELLNIRKYHQLSSSSEQRTTLSESHLLATKQPHLSRCAFS